MTKARLPMFQGIILHPGPYEVDSVDLRVQVDRKEKWCLVGLEESEGREWGGRFNQHAFYSCM